MTDSIKYFLPESEMPKSWYNIAADLPQPPPPVLHVGPDRCKLHHLSLCILSVSERRCLSAAPGCSGSVCPRSPSPLSPDHSDTGKYTLTP